MFFSFHGRLERKSFILYFIASILLQIIVGFIVGFIVGIFNFNTPISLIAIPLVILAFIVHLSLCVRRLHDMNRSSKILFTILLLFIFLSLVENFYFKNDLLIAQYLRITKFLVAPLFYLFLMCKKGIPDKN